MNCSELVACNGRRNIDPTELTTASNEPYFSLISFAFSCTSSAFVASTTRLSIDFPSETRFNFSISLALIITFHPLFDIRLAMLEPIPPDPPIIHTTLL